MLKCKVHIQCYNCNKFGHYSTECRSEGNIEEKANFVEKITEVDSTILLAYQGEGGSEPSNWYLETVASNHMTGKKSLFVEL